MIYIIIPVLNRWSFTEQCLNSLLKQKNVDFKVIVVDHGSTDSTRANIQNNFPWVILLHGDNSMWWTAATNFGICEALKISKSNEDFILTLNNDVEVKENYLFELLKVFDDCKPCLVGSTSVDIKNANKIEFIGGTWNKWFAKYRPNNLKNFPYKEVRERHDHLSADLLPGRGVLIPIEVFKKVGLYDTINFPHYCADDDFSLRCKKNGFRLVVSTKGVVMSHLNESVINNMPFFKYLKFAFFSIKSPNNLSIRLKWAQKHASIPILYFFFDVFRITTSLFKTKLIKSFELKNQ
jgi:GT2 family glycosyltransferase